MKKFKFVCATLLITMLMGVTAMADSIKDVSMNLTYDGKTVAYNAKEVTVLVDGVALTGLDIPAVIIDDRTLVPLRAIFEAMGADVSWDGDSQMITAELNDDTIIMFINNNTGYINGTAFTMDVAPKIINDRTMVPVRAIAEAVGAGVYWDDATRTVSVLSYVIGNEGGTSSTDTSTNNTDTTTTTTTNDSDPQKVTDLSHVDASEIDTEALSNSENEVSVTAVTANGNDSYTIKTSGKIWQYKYATVLGTKVAVDIYGGSLAVSTTNISVNDDPVERIRIAQNAIEPYKIVRVVFDLYDTAGDYSVTKSSDGTSLIVNFGDTTVTTTPDTTQTDNPVIGSDGGTVTQEPSDDIGEEDNLNSITRIRYSDANDCDVVTIYGEEELDYNIFTLSDPYRIVIDIDNSLKDDTSIPDVEDSSYITNIRMSQFTETSTRVVLDVKEGVEFSSYAGTNYVSLQITKSAVTVSESIVNDGKTIRFTKTNGLEASDITYTYDPYSGNTIISLNGDYSGVYGTKTLSYSDDDAEASYISAAKFSTSSGNTTITVTPSLIAEFNIYENGDYIYVDLVDPKTVYDAVVVIDAGHGGTMPGAVVNGFYEKNITLDIAKKVYNQLNSNSIKVYVTRFTDSYVDNYKRAYMANYGADMFISIHCNSIAGDVDIYGTETLYAPHSGEGNGGLTSYTLASVLQKYVTEVCGTYDRGVKNRSDLIVLNRTTVPAALVETGFMTDSSDMALLTSESGRQKFANAIAQAIKEVINTYDYR
ncbi:MAG: N-acetylmuramoyl-L-alanine amidase family protein [Clostridiales bacterium]|nr:N-acetylmuramoyl-L-alanine amidase family protein [Clostridiales bacterium]